MIRIVVLVTLETVILLAAVAAFAVGAQLGGVALLALALITPLVSWARSRNSRPPTHTGEIRTVPREKLDKTKVNMNRPPAQSIPRMSGPAPAQPPEPVGGAPVEQTVPQPTIVEEAPEEAESAEEIADTVAHEGDEGGSIGASEEPVAPDVADSPKATEEDAPTSDEPVSEFDGVVELDRKAEAESASEADEIELESAEPPESSLRDFGPGGGFESADDDDEEAASEEIAADADDDAPDMSRAIDVPDAAEAPPDVSRGITLPGASVEAADDARASEADLTAFAPRTAVRDQEFLIQLFLHSPEALEQVQELARLTDTGSTARPSTTLGEPITHGTTVELRVDAPSLSVDEPIHHLVWRGAATVAHVIARVPADHPGGLAHARIRTLIDGVPVRSAVVSVTVDAPDAVADGGELVAVGSKRYQKAFLSYASEDREKVLEHYQALSALGMEVFQDVLDLDPGERWEKALYTHIASSDVFLLYWSQAAADSPWVRQEAEWALKSQPFDSDGRPDIIPVLLEGPPPAEPPEALQHLHFNDPVRTIISAYVSDD